jgi:very-short-patch-repair endonuclease
MSKVRDKFIRDCNVLIRSLGHKPVSEHRFHPTRRWRFDIAIVDLKIAIEYEGIAGGRSRHTSLTGYTGDADKYNEAQLHGWMVLRFTALNTKKMSDILSRAIAMADSE